MNEETMTTKTVKLTLHVEDMPVLAKSKKGQYVTTKVMMDTDEMRKVPFLPNDDFSSFDEAIDEAGGGLHVVNWKVNAGTYKALAKNAKHPAPCFFGAWTVEIRGIAAKRWTNNATGDTGVTFRFMGLRPVAIEEGESSIQIDDMDVVDYTDADDND